LKCGKPPALKTESSFHQVSGMFIVREPVGERPENTKPLEEIMADYKCVYGTASGTVPGVAPLSRTCICNPL